MTSTRLQVDRYSTSAPCSAARSTAKRWARASLATANCATCPALACRYDTPTMPILCMRAAHHRGAPEVSPNSHGGHEPLAVAGQCGGIPGQGLDARPITLLDQYVRGHPRPTHAQHIA